MNILVLDDDTDILDLMTSFLSSLGHTVTTAALASTAISEVVRRTFDLMLCDIALGDKTGIDVIKEVRSYDPKLPIVMMTSYKEADKVIEAFRAGAMDVLLKPFNWDYIKTSVLDNIIERKK